MEVIIGKTSGFCYGVKRAVEGAKEELKKGNSTVYCLGELVHNRQVIEDLEKEGLEIIETIEEAKGKTIIRAHGVPREVYEKAEKKNIELRDLSCQKVIRIHDIAAEYAKNGWYIFLIGERKHPENIGTISFCGKNSYIIRDTSDIEEATEKLEKTKIKKVMIISQTTYSDKGFDLIVDELKNRLGDKVKFEINKTICKATELRQKETAEIAKQVQYMIIVGGKNSSNTNKLYEIASKYCENVAFAQTKDDLAEEQISKYTKIGVMAGASTPQKSIEEVVTKIKEVNLVES